VPGLPGDDRVECPAGAFPGLKRRRLDLESVPPGQGGHPRVGIDPEHPAVGRLELPGHYAGTDGYSGFKEITRDGFGELIAAIEAGAVDVVIVRDIDRLTRNLTDWNAFEKACVRHGVRLSAYTGGDLGLSTAEGAYYGGMETLRGRGGKARSRARGSTKPRTGRRARAGGPAGPAVVRVYPHLRQSRRAQSQEAAHRAGGNQPGRSGRDPGRRYAGAGARRIGRVDRAGLDRGGYLAGCREAMVADIDCRQIDA
jgi:hypothetical protein